MIGRGWQSRAPLGFLVALAACGGRSTAPVPVEVDPCGPAVLATPAGPPPTTTAPRVEPDGTAMFVYVGTGDEKDVRVVGDFLPKSFFGVAWDPAGQPMTRGENNVWFARLRFHDDARLDYQISVDGKAGPDPLNPRAIESGIAGHSSELVMPAARVATPRDDVPHGTTSVVAESWATPRITVYLPPGYDAHRKYPVVYTADGAAWLELIRLPAILDDMIARHAIEPAIAVMIDAAEDRSAWYTWNPKYVEYLDRVVAYVDAHYATRAEPAGRIHVGTSAGGRASLQAAIARPSTFGRIAMLSPSLPGNPHVYEPLFAGRTKLALQRVWLSAGTYEGAVCEDTRTMARWFRARGVPTKTAFVHQGHSFGNWRGLAGDVLVYVLAR